MKQYKVIDLFKFICAILIIILHTSPFASYSKALTFGFRNIVTVIAVPFFFASSGFLTFSKLNTMSEEQGKAYIKKYVKRLVSMYLIWSAVFFVFVVCEWYKNGFSYMSILIYIRDFFFEGSFSTIWFLPALLYATVFVYLLNKKFSKKAVLLIAVPFYIFGMLGSSYFGISQKIPILKSVFYVYYTLLKSVKNGLLFGFVFVALGAYIAERQNNIKITPKKCVVGFLGSMILVAMEAFGGNVFNLNLKGCDLLISLIPTTVFMLLFALTWEGEFNCSNKLSLTFRKYSLLMFLVQRIPISIIELFLSQSVLMTNSGLNFIAVFLTTMLISFVIIKLSDKIKIFKYLY